jgi:DNA (cytosine-5)-methyltransferase 1
MERLGTDIQAVSSQGTETGEETENRCDISSCDSWMDTITTSSLCCRPDDVSLTCSPQCTDQELIVVDFFCGAGGFTRGALDAGAWVVCGIDSNERCRKTYQYNNRNANDESVHFFASPVEELDPHDIQSVLEGFAETDVAFIACPPCQPFTNLRTTKKRSKKSMGALLAFVRHVEELRPRFVVVENVPGIRNPKYENIWSEFLERLEDVGYEIKEKIVDAKQYGVPQTRRRVLLVAALEEPPPWPEPPLPDGPFSTVADAFAEVALERLEAGQASKNDPLHCASALSPLNLSRIRATPHSGGDRLSWPYELQLRCYKSHSGHTDVYGRMDWKKQAPTLTTRFDSLSNGRFGHPDEDRAITPREGALLQTFPPEYNFFDRSRDENVLHIGNAVPPRQARIVIDSLIERVRTGSEG